MNRRPLIRNLIKDVLENKANLDVKKIITTRPTPMFMQEIPCVCIYYTNESNQFWSGTEYIAKTERRTLQIHIDVLTFAKPDTDDWLDKECAKIELALHDNRFLEDNSKKTTMGLKHESTKPYILEADSEHEIWGASISLELPYESENFIDRKLKDFETYYFSINKVNYNDDTIDPILIEGQGSTKET